MASHDLVKKLPVIVIYIRAIRLVFDNILALTKISFPFILVMAFGQIFPEYVYSPQASTTHGDKSPTLSTPYLIVLCVLFIMAVVGSHRIFLLGSNNAIHIKPVRWSQIETDYLMRWFFLALVLALLFYVIVVPLLAGISFGFSLVPGFISESYKFWIAMTIVSLPFAYVISRIALIFPAAAIGSSNRHVPNTWALSKGNGWRLVILLAVFPGLTWVLTIDWFNSHHLLLDLMDIVVRLVASAIEVAVLSLSYAFLIAEKRSDLSQ